MTPVSLFLVTIAAIFLIGTAGELIFRRTQIPDVVWLLLTGILLGPILGIVTPHQLSEIAPYFGALTLAIVLFDGGSQLDLRVIGRSAPRSGMLAIVTFVGTTAAVAAVTMGIRALGWLPAEWTWSHAVMTGCILGGSSSIIIMPAMALAKVPEDTGSLVNLESAFTDAFCVVGAAAMIHIMVATGDAQVSPATALFQSFGLGASMGAAAGFAWLFVLRLIHASDYAYPVTISALLLLYVAIDGAGGSAALGILTFAVIVGNAERFTRILQLEGDLILGDDVRGFHRQVTFIIKSFFFTFIGAMLSPPWTLVAGGVMVGVVLLVARVPMVAMALGGSSYDAADRRLINVAMPRGLAAGVLASMPVAAGVPATESLPVLVFSAIATSILIFTVGLPLAKRQTP